MDLETLSQLTIGTAAVIVLWFVVRAFLQRLKERDEFLKLLIDNHFKHSQERDERIILILDRIYQKIK